MANSKVTADVADRLLDKLSSDDKFRTHFQNDPRGALDSIGASHVECGGCMKPKNLASKEQLQKSRNVFRDSLLGQSSQQVFNLESK